MIINERGTKTFLCIAVDNSSKNEPKVKPVYDLSIVDFAEPVSIISV